MKNKKISIRYDKFIEKIISNPSAPERLITLEGYIGKSSEEDHIRFYFDASLNRFVEIPIDSIVNAIPKSKEENELGGSKLWIKTDAIFIYGSPVQEIRPKGNLLQGDLYNNFAQVPVNPGTVDTVCCPTNEIGCLQTHNCPTLSFDCPTRNLNVCAVTQNSPGCRVTQNGLGCRVTNNDPGCLVTNNGPGCLVTQNPIPSVCLRCSPVTEQCPTRYNCPTDPPNCPNGKTCVRTCNGPECLPQTSPQTCGPSPTIPGFACRIGNNYGNTGYGFGTFNR